MKLQSVIVIVRHNTSLGGDLRLAQRELDALAGATGTAIKTRDELSEPPWGYMGGSP